MGSGGAAGAGGDGGGGAGGAGGAGGSGVCSPSPWVITSIDVAMNGQQPDLAIDAKDQLWISYYEAGSKTLQVARKVADKFQVETVDSSDAGGDSQIVFAGDVPHILYKDYANGGVKHAAFEGGMWKNEVVEMSVSDGLSLAADSNGKLHASFYVQDDVRYATNTSGAWAVEVVNTAFQPGTNTSIALRNGIPEIVYTQRENNIFYRVYHAERVDATTWNKVDVTSTGMFDVTNPFIVDPMGGRHIFCGTGGGLLHMQEQSSVWASKETIATSAVATSSVLDAKGVFHVAHLDIGAQRVSYSSNATGSFKTTEVDAMSFATNGSLGVDSTGRVHIAYYDLAGKRVMYATSCP